MTRDADERIALAATTAKLAGRVATLDFAGTNRARGQLAHLLDAMASAMWCGASYDELHAALSTMAADFIDGRDAEPIPDEKTPIEAPHAKR